MALTQEIIYLYGAVSIIIIVLLWVAFMTWRTKRIILKQIQNEQRQSYPQPVQQGYYPPQNYPY